MVGKFPVNVFQKIRKKNEIRKEKQSTQNSTEEEIQLYNDNSWQDISENLDHLTRLSFGAFHSTQISDIMLRKFPEKISRKFRNFWNSEKRTVQPKVLEILQWKSNGTEISRKLGIPHQVVLFFSEILIIRVLLFSASFFWARSQRVKHLTQGWRRRVFENGDTLESFHLYVDKY